MNAVVTRHRLLSSLSRATIARFATSTSSSAEMETVQQQLFEVLFSNDAALLKDKAFGFSTRSLDHAADELGLSRACSAAINPAEIVHEFNRLKLSELSERLADRGPQPTMHEGLYQGVRERLALLEPYQETWAGALATIASPEEVPPTLHHVERLTSAVLEYAGDIPAADMTWYSKRMLLGGIIGVAEVQLASGDGSLDDILLFADKALRKLLV